MTASGTGRWLAAARTLAIIWFVVAGLSSLEERMEDLHAVLDAVGSERCALLGISEGGPMSLLFAATYPERASALVLYGSYALHPTVTRDNIDEHAIAVDATNPEKCTPQVHCSHAHGPNCGHQAVPHGDHVDYLVDGRLHHPHGDHCDDHGPVQLA